MEGGTQECRTDNCGTLALLLRQMSSTFPGTCGRTNSERNQSGFSVIIDSSEVGSRKPEKEIFDVLFQSTALSASSSLFIDDDAQNVAAGQSFGLNCHHFTETTEALKALDAFVSNGTRTREETASLTPPVIQ